MMVQVTQADIDTCVHGDPSACPIARALSRCAGGSWSVGIAYVNDPTSSDPGRRMIRTTLAMKEFIARFDEKLPVHPIQFNLCVEPV